MFLTEIQAGNTLIFRNSFLSRVVAVILGLFFVVTAIMGMMAYVQEKTDIVVVVVAFLFALLFLYLVLPRELTLDFQQKTYVLRQPSPLWIKARYGTFEDFRELRVYRGAGKWNYRNYLVSLVWKSEGKERFVLYMAQTLDEATAKAKRFEQEIWVPILYDTNLRGY